MKLTKASAQSKIIASAHAMSEELLGHEVACFTAMRATFTAAIPTVALKTVRGIRNSHDTREAWVDAHTLAIVDSTDHVGQLAHQAEAVARAAIRTELLLCESALPAGRAGLTDRASFRSDRIVDSAVEGWQGGMAGQRAEYRRAQTHELSRAKTIEDLTEALWGEQGVWWAAVTAAERWARWVSIRVSNKVRVAAMKAFNDAG